MAVIVVEGFETIDIHHCDGVFTGQAGETLVQSPAVGDIGQFIDINPVPVHLEDGMQLDGAD